MFLEKLNKAFSSHAHYKGKAGPQDRSLPDASFKLIHYAGEVVYAIDGFLDKNTDTLFKDLSQVTSLDLSIVLHVLNLLRLVDVPQQ